MVLALPNTEAVPARGTAEGVHAADTSHARASATSGGPRPAACSSRGRAVGGTRDAAFIGVTDVVSTAGAAVIGTVGAVLSSLTGAIPAAGSTIRGACAAGLPCVACCIAAARVISVETLDACAVHTLIRGAQIVAIITVDVFRAAVRDGNSRDALRRDAGVSLRAFVSIITGTEERGV